MPVADDNRTIEQESTSHRSIRTTTIDPSKVCPPQNGKFPVFLPHTENCSLYYVCDHGIPKLMRCPAPLHFNRELNVCDYEWRAGCSTNDHLSSKKPEVSNSSSTYISDPTRVTDSPFSTTRSENTFQPSKNRTEVVISSRDEDVFNTTMPVADDNRTIEQESTSHRSIRTTTIDPSKVCPPQNGKFPVFLPHTENCSLYYVCDHGIPKLMRCPAPLHFNRELNVCDYEWRAGCSTNDHLSSKKPEVSNSSSTYISDPTRVTDSPFSTTRSENTFQPSKNRTEVVISSRDENVFNTTMPVADDNRTIEQESTSHRSIRTTTIYPSKVCPPQNGKFPVFLPHTENCSLYYVCDHGIPKLMRCPAPLHFNRELNVCDYEWRAGCSTNDHLSSKKPEVSNSSSTYISDPTRVTDSPFSTTRSENTFQPSKNRTEVVISSRDENVFNTTMPVADDNRTIEQESTSHRSIRTTTIYPSKVCPPQNGKFPVFLPHTENCSLYYVCDHGIPKLMRCPAPLHFNRELNVCDYEWRAGCSTNDHLSSKKPEVSNSSSTYISDPTRVTDSPFSTTRSENTFQPSKNRTEVVISSRDENVFNTTMPVADDNRTIEQESTSHRSIRTTTIDPSKVCPPQNGKFPVFLPHTENCSLYYVCDHGIPKLMRCPAPLHFNRELNVCDYEWRAGCSTNDHLSSKKPEVSNSSSTYISDPTRVTDSPFSTTRSENTFQPSKNRTEVVISSRDEDVFNTTMPVADDNRTIEQESTSHRSIRTTTIYPSKVCPPQNGKFPVFLPHTENCSLYYVCDHGIPKLMRCPAPLHFNRELNVCDYEWRAGCSTNDHLSSKKPEVSNSSSTYISDPTRVTDSPFSTTRTENTFQPSKNRTEVVISSRDENVFNTTMPVADDNRTIEQESTSHRSIRTTTIDPSKVCPPQNGKFPVFLPHTENCSLYYVCDHGIPKLMRCPAPLHFNRELNVCDYEWRAGCSTNGHLSSKKPEVSNSSSTYIFDPTRVTDSPFSTTRSENTFQPSKNRTEVVISSRDQDVFNTTMPVGDDNRTIEQESTSHRSIRTTTIDPSKVCPPQNGKFPVFLPHTENCSLYYVCDHGIPKLMRCPAPLHFNRELNVCDYEWRAGCSTNGHLSSKKPEVSNSSSTYISDPTRVTDSPFSTTRSENTFQPSKNRTEVVISSRDQDVFNTTMPVGDDNRTIEQESTSHRSIKTTTIDPSKVCPLQNGKFSVFLPHTENCSLYYVCDHGIPKLMCCPATLHFNRELNVCDYEWRAGCSTNGR
ncbi:uncharacterized protein LOC143255581 isoform X2 [Tachypleus tridentatus]|uniref:uncharacterized protein LOC143255581 isoform X2 n=1 Tax=Tachypleus tridentatus TaxID=6853 RepID=UPI003FD2C45D